MHQGWFPTAGPNGAKCLYQTEEGEQKCHRGSVKVQIWWYFYDVWLVYV